jgi:hypothetical protein
VSLGVDLNGQLLDQRQESTRMGAICVRLARIRDDNESGADWDTGFTPTSPSEGLICVMPPALGLG